MQQQVGAVQGDGEVGEVQPRGQFDETAFRGDIEGNVGAHAPGHENAIPAGAADQDVIARAAK